MRFPTDLRVRHRQAEVMDQPGLDDASHREALVALRRVNAFSAGMQAIWPLIREVGLRRMQRGDPRPVRVLDVATGGGDFPVRLWKRARREGLHLTVAGCDRSPLAIAHAVDHAHREGANVTFFEHDVLVAPFPSGYDVHTSSLFLHHLDEPDALAFLNAMGQAGELVLIDDLRRSRAGWALAFAGIRLLSRSKIAHIDGPRSVEGAFTIEEVENLARQAGWADFQVRPHWPCRFLLLRKGREGIRDR